MFYITSNTFHDAYSTSNSLPSDDSDQTDYSYTNLGPGNYEVIRPLKPSDTSEDEEFKTDEGV